VGWAWRWNYGMKGFIDLSKLHKTDSFIAGKNTVFYTVKKPIFRGATALKYKLKNLLVKSKNITCAAYVRVQTIPALA
jgi:hypothetical protein